MMQFEPEKSPPALAFSSLTSPALALSLFVTFCVWLYVATSTPFSFRSTQVVNLEAVSTATSDLSALVPLLKALGVHQRHQELGRNQTVQYLLHVLSKAGKPPAAAAAAAANGASNDSAFRAAVANVFRTPISKLCHWLEDDVTAFNIQQRVLVAGLLTNTEALMPHYLLELLKFVTAMPSGNVFVTLYESGSTDLTGLAAALVLLQPSQLQHQCLMTPRSLDTILHYHVACMQLTGPKFDHTFFDQHTPTQCSCAVHCDGTLHQALL